MTSIPSTARHEPPPTEPATLVQANAETQRLHQRAWFVLTATISCILLGYRLGFHPIDLWDESRLANNALEMARSGLSLVTTFDGAPDHWNTKPPLLIWLMAICIRLLGANEWAVRLPSVMAAFATGLIMFLFCARHLRKPALGFGSVMLLFLSFGYVTNHGARSGDYDAMLTLGTTSYLISAYLYLHGRAEHRTRWLAVCALGIVLAFMTKTIQGMIFLPALLMYAAYERRLMPMVRSRAVQASVVLVLLVCVGYYIARESVDPGYFAAVKSNDLLGRFNTVLDEHAGGFWWYVLQVDRCFWLVPGLTAAAWLAWRGRGEKRRLAMYLGTLCVFYLVVISLAKTKLPWYPIPIYPLLALLVALCLESIVRHMARAEGRPAAEARRKLAWIYAGLGATALVSNIMIVESRGNESHVLNNFLRGPIIRNSNLNKIVVLHPGYLKSGGDYYVAPSLFYVNQLRHEGFSIVIQPPSKPIPAGYDTIMMCGRTRSEFDGLGALKPIATDEECGLYALAS
ncbi:MAG: glycosyltransferase family 39 protein [Rhizobacter sp.]